MYLFILLILIDFVSFLHWKHVNF